MTTVPGSVDDSGPFPDVRLYQLAMESLPDTVFVADTDGTIRWACSNVTHIFGRDATEFVESETVASVLAPEFVDPLETGTDQRENQRLTVTDAGGDAHHLLVTVTRITVDAADEPDGSADEHGVSGDDTADALLYACRDVTDVERLAHELDEVFDRITDGFVALDTEFVITYANDSAADLFGHSRSDLVGTRLWEFSSDPESTTAFELFPAVLRTGEPTSYETYFEPQDRWYETRVYPSETGLSVYFRDVTERVHRAEELEASEARFRTLFEEIPDPLLVVDDDATVVDANAAMCDLVGEPRESVVGRSAAGLTDPSFDFEAAWDAFLDAGELQGEVTIVRADEERRIVEYTGVAEVWPGEHIAALRDVTEREEYRAELDEIHDRIADGFFSVDRDLRIEYANERFARTVGYDLEELVGVYLWDVVDDAETLEAFELLPEVLEAGEPTTYEGYHEPAGVWYEISVYPSETGLSVYSRDVTERVEGARALEESESRFRALFERSLDALVLADDEGRYVDVNPAACELYGLSREELLGKTAADFAPPEYDFEAAWSAFLEQEATRGEFELVRPDGDVRIAEFAARANVRPGEHLSILRDVTERVERERQLEIQRDELARLDHINRLVREVNQAVVGADTRTEVLSDVCGRLVAADVYRHVLVTTEVAGGRFEVTSAAGLSTVAASATVSALERELLTAGRRRTSIVTPSPDDLQSRDDVDADVFGCFPIVYAGTIHGVLLVGAEWGGGPPPLVGGEEGVLDDLSTTVGKAITAVTARRLLHADEVVTLEFTVDDAGDAFNQLSRTLGATVTVTALVPMADGRHACYLHVTDETDGGREWDAEEVYRSVEAVDAVDGCRVITTEGALRLEVHVDDDSPALLLETQGSHVRRLSSTDGVGVLVVEVPTETNVRSLVAGLREEYPETNLVRKRQESRSAERASAIGGRSPVALAGEEMPRPLTEKQLAALRAAHAGGYYDWPRRGSSAQELADALGVAPATYHQHLRAAERKLVDAFFQD
ncbi:PAS domain S-box protein [Salinigranum salinum]|uniref:PAS domain S-box protein n=1 Tax=Salinigranum salinum TaxID=1364937 RepID=UPI0012609A89|nr:PAS domain S-box protein [Salinigranum salinum]